VDAVREAPGRLTIGNLHPRADEARPPIGRHGGIPASRKERRCGDRSRSASASSGIEEGGHSASGRHCENGVATVLGEAAAVEAQGTGVGDLLAVGPSLGMYSGLGWHSCSVTDDDEAGIGEGNGQCVVGAAAW
jgi:hypothetical protein